MPPRRYSNSTLRVLPDFLVRFVAVALTRTVYRMRVLGVENVPVEGGEFQAKALTIRITALQNQGTRRFRPCRPNIR